VVRNGRRPLWVYLAHRDRRWQRRHHAPAFHKARLGACRHLLGGGPCPETRGQSGMNVVLAFPQAVQRNFIAMNGMESGARILSHGTSTMVSRLGQPTA
jgi:hypothetical protein